MVARSALRLRSVTKVLGWHKASNTTHGGTAIKSSTSERPNGAFVAFLRDPDGNRLTARTQPTRRMSRVIERTSSAAAGAVGADSCDIKTSSAQIDLSDDAPGYREAESSTPRHRTKPLSRQGQCVSAALRIMM